MIENECPLCASRNISYSEREKALVCRDCGSVLAGTPIEVSTSKEVKVEEVLSSPNEPREIVITAKPIIKKAQPKKVKKVKKKPKKAKKKKVKKKAKKKPKKKAKKKIKKKAKKKTVKKKAKKKTVKRKAKKKVAKKKPKKKKGFVRRLLRR